VPHPPSPFAEVLSSFNDAFSELGVGWYLFGAQAAILYGATRLTADVDVTVQLGRVTTAELGTHLVVQGFALRVHDESFLRTTRVLPVVHGKTRIPADVVIGGPGLEELFLSRAIKRKFVDFEIPVACPEDIVAMKLLAGREKDASDVESVLRANRLTIDRTRLLETLGMLEEALGQSDLVPMFERLWVAATRKRPRT
jgi:hypothetical protein